MKSSPKINIKLIQGLSLLSELEFNEFINFATSKYFSGQRSYSRILDLLKEVHKTHFKGYDNKGITDHLMNLLNLNKNTLLNRMSELYKIYEMFVVIRELKYLPEERNKILMEYYTEKKSHKLFDYVHKISTEALKREKVSSKKIRHELMISELYSTHLFKLGKNKLYTEQSSLKAEFKVYHFILDLLKDNIELMQQKFLGNKHYTETPELILGSMSFDELFESLKKKDQEYYDLIRIIYYLYLSLKDFSNTKLFKTALKIHRKIKPILNDPDNEYIYFLMITYCINQTNLDKPVFYKYLFRIIKDKLKDGYYSELTENNFPVNNFRDYVLIGLKVGENEWVRSFIENYSHYLPSEIRQDDILLAYGMIANNEGKFEEALKSLKKVKKKNYIHYVDSTFYKLRSYYELKYYDEALMEIEKIKKYFKSNTNIPSIYIKNYIPHLNDITILLKYAEGKMDLIDLKLYFKKSNLDSKKSWATIELKKILKSN